MATKNIVPRADGEGSLGTSAKKWGSIYTDNFNADTLTLSSLTVDTLTVDTLTGTTITGTNITASDTLKGGTLNVSGTATVEDSLSVTNNITSSGVQTTTLTTSTLSASGAVTADSVSAATITATGALNSGNILNSGTLTTTNLTVTGIIEVPTPSSGIEAANKDYVDTAVAGVQVGSYVLPVATSSVLGGVMVGAGLAVTGEGVLSAEVTSSDLATVRTSASEAKTTAEAAQTSANEAKALAEAAEYTLPVATSSALGGVMVGDGLAVTEAGVLSVAAKILTAEPTTSDLAEGEVAFVVEE